MLIATACMFTLPILTFYLAKMYFANYPEPDNYAGAAAILMTNVIVAAYCVHAYRQDQHETMDGDENDADRPRVGIYKQRTD